MNSRVSTSLKQSDVLHVKPQIEVEHSTDEVTHVPGPVLDIELLAGVSDTVLNCWVEESA